MPAVLDDRSVDVLHIMREVSIAAPIEVVFQSLLEELGPEGQMPDNTPFPMRLEPWPGGRWLRDLGDDAGHLWGHVQVIKQPTLLEICGPMFMSYASMNHLQYRLTTSGSSTVLQLTHTAIGCGILGDVREGVTRGWQHRLERVRNAAERREHASNPGRKN